VILKALVEEFIGFVQDEHLYVAGAEYAPSNHVKNPAGCSGDDVLAIFKFTYVFTNRGASDARVTLHIHVVTQCKNHGLDLSRKFAGGGEDERLRLAHGVVDRL
jgi:hypothetical protein